MSERLERLVNLTATLLDTRRPLTIDELAERLEPGYPSDGAARHRQFERDKELLRELGVPITVEPIDALGGEVGYRIRPEDYYLADPGLTPEEQAALHVAVTAVDLAGVDASNALRKLGGVVGDAAGAAVASFEVPPHLGKLFEAVTRRSVVTFDYRGTPRSLEPYGILHRFGHWYVVGHDRDRDAPRAFRVDRIEGRVRTSEPGAFDPPPDVDPGSLLSDDPLSYGDDRPREARVLVEASRAAWVVEQLGGDAVCERRPDGSIVVTLHVVNRDAFRSWVLGLLDHAEVLEPPELRDDIVTWLEAIR